MDKLTYYQKQFPDAVEYLDKNQSYIREDQARFIAYGMKEVEAKVLFYRDIPSTTGVTQQYIFSKKAFIAAKAEAERKATHDEHLMEPYH